jgi:hypothetical protein
METSLCKFLGGFLAKKHERVILLIKFNVHVDAIQSDSFKQC